MDEAARAAGRDPADDRADRRRPGPACRAEPAGSWATPTREQSVARSTGPTEHIADELRAYAREGIGHVQLVVDPITEASVAALAPVLEALDRG